jgi:hypothetical protein
MTKNGTKRVAKRSTDVKAQTEAQREDERDLLPWKRKERPLIVEAHLRVEGETDTWFDSYIDVSWLDPWDADWKTTHRAVALRDGRAAARAQEASSHDQDAEQDDVPGPRTRVREGVGGNAYDGGPSRPAAPTSQHRAGRVRTLDQTCWCEADHVSTV